MTLQRYTLDSLRVLGRGQTTGAQIQAWLEDRAAWGAEYAGFADVQPIPAGFGDTLVTLCEAYGINWDGEAAQIKVESAALQSAIYRAKLNLTGYGAVDGNAFTSAWTFRHWRDSIEQTLRHLLCYAVGPDADPRAMGKPEYIEVPPRCALVVADRNAGTVVRFADLQGKYATSKTYATTLLDNANALIDFANAHGEEPPVGTPYDHIIPGLIDVRSQLATRSPGEGGVERGPYERIPLSEKRGVVIHYRGVVTPADAGLASYRADAEYHVGKNWARPGDPPVLGSGIMYHIGVDGQGQSYLMRDLDRVLWHCGAWPQNANTLAIQLPLGGSQRATPVQLARTRAIVDAWLAFTKAGRDEVWGHKQLSSTDCPGTLMDDLVIPYRTAVTPPAPPAPSGNPLDHVVVDPWKDYAGGNAYGTFYLPTIFVDWINRNGGFWSIGRVVTGAINETQPDGTVLLVQYFEGGRLEHHPENAGTAYEVLRGHTGLEVLAERHPELVPRAA